MDQEFRPITGDLINGRLHGIPVVLNNHAPYGTVYRTQHNIICRPTNDLVWGTYWQNFLQQQREKARWEVKELTDGLRIKLGIPLV